MPANNSNLELLSNTLSPSRSVKTERLHANQRDNQQGDSFKTVINRNRDSQDNGGEQTPKAAADGEPKENTTARAEPGTRPDTESKQGMDAKKNPGETRDSAVEETPESAESPPANTATEVIKDAEPQHYFLPAATLVPAGGNNLPPTPGDGSTVSLDRLTAVTSKSVAEAIEKAVAELRSRPHAADTATANIDDAKTPSVQTVPKVVDAEKPVIDLKSPAVEIADTAKTTAVPTPTPGTVSKLNQTPAVEVNIDTIKLSVGATDETALTKNDTLTKTPEPTWRYSAHSVNNTSAPVTTATGRETFAIQSEQVVLDNKVSNAVTTEATGEKPATIPGTETGFTIKTSSPAVDQQWIQQFQNMHAMANQGKSGAVQLQVPLNIHNPQWFAAMADRVSWLASQAIQAAEIHLDPPELGPLQVRIAVNNDQASVNFVSHQASVRDALDSQLLRLRELLSEQGLNLVDVNVSDRHQQEQQQGEGRGGRGSGGQESDISTETPSMLPVNTIRHWVDYYV